ncbi:MAG: hypothetical protein OHK0039_48970 [Bacteroidia bacterium]
MGTYRAAPPETQPPTLEHLINYHLRAYPLSEDVRFKLAVYAELKGQYDPDADAFVLAFGSLGHLSFYHDNLLLRVPGAPTRVYHLDRFDLDSPTRTQVDTALHTIFEQVSLLSNHQADPGMVRLIDQSLARKNLEPFTKLYLRHILLRYGEYDPLLETVVFRSQHLPRRAAETDLMRQPATPLMLKLDRHSLRGYYLQSGGTVYIEDVDRKVRYATGEEYATNIAAFKLFAQQLFLQTVQYITHSEELRLRSVRLSIYITSGGKTGHMPAVEPLYHPYSWIPMMLTLLRENDVNIGDEDVICYFVGEEYFPRLYDQLVPGERTKVDAYLAAHPTTVALSEVAP